MAHKHRYATNWKMSSGTLYLNLQLEYDRQLFKVCNKGVDKQARGRP